MPVSDQALKGKEMQIKFWRQPKSPGDSRPLSIVLFLFLLVCNAYVFPRWADPNQNSRLDMVIAVVEDGTFQIDRYVANTVDYAKIGEHYYSDKAPGAAFVGIPLYAGLKVILDSPLLKDFTDRIGQSEAFRNTLRAEGSGVYAEKVRFALAQVALALAVSALPTALLGVLIFQSLAYFSVPTGIRLFIAIGYGLLTPAFAYANAFYGHQLSAALLFAAFYLILRNKGLLTIPQLLMTGVLLGYSVVTEYPAALVAGILFLYTFYWLHRQGRWSYILYVVLTGGIVAAGWMLYNTQIFGGPLNLGYSHSELWTDQHSTGFMSLTLPDWDALLGITFSLFRGLFILAPWLLFALPGVFLWWRTGQERATWWVVTASIASMFLFNASSGMWWGGYAIGPRYLLPALPFLAFSTAFAIVRWQERLWFRWIAALALLASFILVWGLTLAGQAFPPDYLYNPLIEYALPNWQQGNVARNVGTLLGFEGVWSLVPLLLFTGVGSWYIFLLAHTSQQSTNELPVNRKPSLSGIAHPSSR